MDAESLEILCLRNEKDYLKYKEEFLFDDKDVEDAPCSFKSTPYTAALIGSRITSCLVNHICNTVENNDLRVIPFYLQEIIPIFYTNSYELQSDN